MNAQPKEQAGKARKTAAKKTAAKRPSRKRVAPQPSILLEKTRGKRTQVFLEVEESKKK